MYNVCSINVNGLSDSKQGTLFSAG